MTKAFSTALADRVRHLARLRGWREWALLAYVVGLAPLVPLLMRLSLSNIELLLTRRGSRVARGMDPERVAVVVEAAQRLAHPLVGRGCLTRGVSLFWLLRQPGADDELRLCFGLGGPKDGYSGHCWLERNRLPFLESSDPRVRFPEQYAIQSSATPPR